MRGFLARCRYKARVKKAQRQQEEMNSFLLQLAKLSLDQQQKLSKVLQGDKKIPKCESFGLCSPLPTPGDNRVLFLSKGVKT